MFLKASSSNGVLKLFTFLVFMSSSLLMSYFPLYFDSLGYSKLQIGLLTSFGPMIGMISTIAWGFASDKFQTVTKILLALFIGQLIISVSLLQTQSYQIVFLLTCAYYFFQQPQISLNDSLSLARAQSSGSNFAIFRIWASLGFACASVIFGQLTNSFGSGITIYLCAGMSVVLIAMNFTVRDIPGGASKMNFSGMRNVLLSRQLLWFLLLVLLISTTHRLNDSFLGIYLRELGASNAVIGYSWMLSSTSEIVSFYLLSKHGHKFRELPLLAIAAVGYAIRLFTVSTVDNIYVIMGLQLTHMVTFGIFFITAIRYLQNIIPDKYRSTGLAVFTAIWTSAGGLVSGLVGGAVYEAWGGSALYRVGAALAVVTAALFLTTEWRARRRIM